MNIELATAPTRPGFHDLPPEIRNQIYDIALRCKVGIIHATGTLTHDCPRCECPDKALFSVSKRVRQDAQPIFIGNHEVLIRLHVDQREERLQHWLASLCDEAIAAITQLGLVSFRPGRGTILPLVFRFELQPLGLEIQIGWSLETMLGSLEQQAELRAILNGLPEVQGRKALTRKALREMCEAVYRFQAGYELD